MRSLDRRDMIHFHSSDGVTPSSQRENLSPALFLLSSPLPFLKVWEIFFVVGGEKSGNL